MTDNLNHTHLILTARTPPDICDKLTPENLKTHLETIVKDIGMTILTPPQIGYSNEPDNTGYSGTIGITTSHISFHHWDCISPGALQYDIFSCRQFEETIAARDIVAFWQCSIISAKVMTRWPHFCIVDLSIADLLIG